MDPVTPPAACSRNWHNVMALPLHPGSRPPCVCICREGQEMLLNDGRPNDELLLATGMLQVYALATIVG